jgi:hypothetical protein
MLSTVAVAATWDEGLRALIEGRWLLREEGRLEMHWLPGIRQHE